MDKQDNYYPPVNFHFRVTELGGDIDMNFREVSGLNAQLQTETLKEGGENTYEQTLPVRVKYTDVVLKRGVVSAGQSDLTRWLKDAYENFKFKARNFNVVLLNEKHEPLMQWQIVHALPKNWKFSDLNAERGEILIETLELSYNHFIFGDP